MPFKVNTLIVPVAVLSWLLSIYLLARLWRGNDHIAIKLGLTLLLVVPVFGPLVCVWVQNFPTSNDPDLMDQRGYSDDVLARWRSRLEQHRKLPPLEQLFRRGRRK